MMDPLMNSRLAIMPSSHSMVSSISPDSIPVETYRLGSDGMIASRGNQNRWDLMPTQAFGDSVRTQLRSSHSFRRISRQSYLRFVRTVEVCLSTLRILSFISSVIPICRALGMGIPSRTGLEWDSRRCSDTMADTEDMQGFEGCGGGSI